jgi:hypothetical protein
MDSLFLILFLLSFLAILIGLISPKTIIKWGSPEKRTRGKVFKFYGLTLIASFILFGITAPEVTPEEKAAQEAEEKAKQEAKAKKEAEEKPKQETKKKKIAKENVQKVINKEANINEAQQEQEKAYKYLREKKYNEAMKAVENSIKLEDKNADAYVARSIIRFNKLQFEEKLNIWLKLYEESNEYLSSNLSISENIKILSSYKDKNNKAKKLVKNIMVEINYSLEDLEKAEKGNRNINIEKVEQRYISILDFFSTAQEYHEVSIDGLDVAIESLNILKKMGTDNEEYEKLQDDIDNFGIVIKNYRNGLFSRLEVALKNIDKDTINLNGNDFQLYVSNINIQGNYNKGKLGAQTVETKIKKYVAVNKANTPEEAIELVDSLAPGNYSAVYYEENDKVHSDGTHYFFIGYSAVEGGGGEFFVEKGSGRIYGVKYGTDQDPTATIPDLSIVINNNE